MAVSMNSMLGEVDDDRSVGVGDDAGEHVHDDGQREEVGLPAKDDDCGRAVGGHGRNERRDRNGAVRELGERHRLLPWLFTRERCMRYQGPEQRSRRVPS